MLRNHEMVKRAISFSNKEANSTEDLIPYIEIGHKNIKQDGDDLTELIANCSSPFFVDYPYFREVPEDDSYSEWKINPKSNVFETIHKLIQPTDLEKKVSGGIHDKIIPVISRLKNKGSLKNIAVVYEGLFRKGRELGYRRLGIRIPIRIGTNFETTDIPIILRFLTDRDFMLLDLRGEIRAEKKEELIKNLKDLISKVEVVNKSVNIILLNAKVNTPSDVVGTRKENVGARIARNIGIYGYGDYLFEPETNGFNTKNNKKNFNLYYYDYLENTELKFHSEESYLDSLEKMKNDVYFFDLLEKHSEFCTSCRVLISILNNLPQLPANFRSLKVDLRENHYLTDVYLEMQGFKEKLGWKE